MDNNTIFIKTDKGGNEARNRSAHLSGDTRRVLLMVDGTATFGEIYKRVAPGLRGSLDGMFKELESGDLIRRKTGAVAPPRIVVPPEAPHKKTADEGIGEELDFAAAFQAPSAAAAEKAKQTEAARHKVEQEIARDRAELAAAEAEAEARAEKARQEIEAAALKVRQEAGEARLKAEREAAKAREEAGCRAREEAARHQAEQEMARARAELAAAKTATAARMPSAEEVTQLAKEQAKTWAEAERRSAEAARASAERAARPHVGGTPPVARSRRKPLPWGKIGVGLFAVLLAALFVVPPLLPTRGYATAIEQLLADKLKQPVHIGQLAGRLLPTPRLELKDMSIGETKPFRAQQAQIDFAFSALFSPGKPITGIELEGVHVDGPALKQISAWLQEIAADTRYPVARIMLGQGTLEAGGVQISGIDGELGFGRDGKFARAKFHAGGGKFALDIDAAPENKMQVSVAVRGGALPWLPDWVFDDLSAKGELDGDSLMITGLDGRIMGGTLLGDARIDWRSGWRAQGSLTARNITSQNVNKLLNGDMDGAARFQMQSASLSGLVESATLEGGFSVKKGVINGVDIIETTRLRSRESLPGGRTHFDLLSGDLHYADGSYHFKKIKLAAGVLSAAGTLDIAGKKLSGRISADLTMRAGMGSVALQIDGTTDSPLLYVVR